MDRDHLTPAASTALAKASLRLLPLIGLGYGVAYLDRLNISFAALQMNAELHFSAAVYGLGAGLFFLSYAALEAPSNLLLLKVGPRRWLARIMISWGVLSAAMMFVRTPWQFYTVRLLLGAAEAGFFPGAIYYLTLWFPPGRLGRAISGFYVAYPLATLVMGALAGSLLGLDGTASLRGWQWLFLAEGAPACLVGLLFLRALPDRPAAAPWLTQDERTALEQAATARRPEPGGATLLSVLADPRVLAMGLGNAVTMGCTYAFAFSTPVMLKAQGLTTGQVGALVAAGGLLGAIAMVGAGWLADRTRDRFVLVIGPTLMIGLGYLAFACAGHPDVAIGAYLTTELGRFGVQGAFWAIVCDLIRGPRGAVAIAVVGSFGQGGAFLATTLFGALHDLTGGYRLAVALLALGMALSAGAFLMARIARSPKPMTVQPA